MYYDSEAIYINSCTDARAKVAAINACIDALLTSVLSSMGKAEVEEYMLNDGQTIIKTIYRNPQAVTQAVGALRIVRQQYINDINSQSARMVDAKNLYIKRRGIW